MSLYSDFGDQKYRLLQLTPELVEYIKNPNAVLQLKSKSDSGEVMVCTNDKTYKIREAHHSNSLFVAAAQGSAMLKPENEPLAHDQDGDTILTTSANVQTKSYEDLPQDAITLLDNVSAIWEPIELNDKTISLPSNLPIYRGFDSHADTQNINSHIEKPSFRSLKELKADTPLSDKQIDHLWAKKGGVQLSIPNQTNDLTKRAFLISSNVVYRVLSSILASLELFQSKRDGNTKSNDYTNIQVLNLYNNMGNLTEKNESKKSGYEEPLDVVESVVKMFSKETFEPYTLDMAEIIRWYGLETLKKHGSSNQNSEATELLDIDDFMSRWNRSFPVAIVAPELKQQIQLSTLDGHYIKLQNNKLIFFDAAAAFSMSPDPRSRFAWLLDIKPEWELEEIWSLVKDVAPDNVKRESYIMKFARKRKVGRKVMISKR